MVNNLAVTKVKFCDLLHIRVRKCKVPDADILLHTLHMNRLRQNGNTALRVPFEGDLCGGLSVLCTDLRENRVREDGIMIFIVCFISNTFVSVFFTYIITKRRPHEKSPFVMTY